MRPTPIRLSLSVLFRQSYVFHACQSVMKDRYTQGVYVGRRERSGEERPHLLGWVRRALAQLKPMFSAQSFRSFCPVPHFWLYPARSLTHLFLYTVEDEMKTKEEKMEEPSIYFSFRPSRVLLLYIPIYRKRDQLNNQTIDTSIMSCEWVSE